MARTDKIRGKSDTEPKPVEIGVQLYPGAQTSAAGGLTDLFVTANRMSTERKWPARGSRPTRLSPTGHLPVEGSGRQRRSPNSA
jgi:transcriptional regulator GlxA family with amidase domain